LADHDKTITLKVHEGEEIEQLLQNMKKQIGLTDASLDEIKTLVDEQL
jgi:ribosomal protein S21